MCKFEQNWRCPKNCQKKTKLEQKPWFLARSTHKRAQWNPLWFWVSYSDLGVSSVKALMLATASGCFSSKLSLRLLRTSLTLIGVIGNFTILETLVWERPIKSVTAVWPPQLQKLVTMPVTNMCLHFALNLTAVLLSSGNKLRLCLQKEEQLDWVAGFP